MYITRSPIIWTRNGPFSTNTTPDGTKKVRQISVGPLGGDKEIRTLDPLLAKQVLYQLSYTPNIFKFQSVTE